MLGISRLLTSTMHPLLLNARRQARAPEVATVDAPAAEPQTSSNSAKRPKLAEDNTLTDPRHDKASCAADHTESKSGIPSLSQSKPSVTAHRSGRRPRESEQLAIL